MESQKIWLNERECETTSLALMEKVLDEYRQETTRFMNSLRGDG